MFPLSCLNELNQVVFYSFAFQQNHGAGGLWAACDTIVRRSCAWSVVTVTARPHSRYPHSEISKLKSGRCVFFFRARVHATNWRRTRDRDSPSESCLRSTRRASPHRSGCTVNKSYLLISRTQSVDWAVCFAAQCNGAVAFHPKQRLLAPVTACTLFNR